MKEEEVQAAQQTENGASTAEEVKKDVNKMNIKELKARNLKNLWIEGSEFEWNIYELKAGMKHLWNMKLGFSVGRAGDDRLVFETCDIQISANKEIAKYST